MTLEYGVVKFFGVITLHFFFLLTPNAPLIASYTVTKTNKRTDVGKKKTLNPNAQLILCFWCFLLITSDNN